MIVNSPRQLLSALPHLIGFHPDNSIVTVAMNDDEILTIARVDFSTEPIQLPSSLLAILRQSKKPSVVLVAYCASDISLEQLLELVPQADEFQLLDALWVHSHRWRSLMCNDSQCCPEQGNELSEVTATELEFVVAGSAPFASREDLANRLETVILSSQEAKLRDAALRKTQERFLAQEKEHQSKVPGRVQFLDQLVQLWSSDSVWGWDEYALLTVVVNDIQMRDGLLRQMLDNPHLRLLMRTTIMSAVSQVSDEHVSALATTLAGCAWLDGNGAMATVSLERALSADPSYSLARLLERAISHNVPPSVWTESLEAVSYEECLAGAA